MTGKLIIFSAPSGSGKSTLINYLMGQDLNLAFSISATSRPPRGTERDGVEYFFLTPEEFRQRIANGEFLEYEEVYKDRFYGTLKAQVEKQLEAGQNVVFDVDVHGGCRIKEFYGDRALSRFIQPPPVDELRRRLESPPESFLAPMKPTAHGRQNHPKELTDQHHTVRLMSDSHHRRSPLAMDRNHHRHGSVSRGASLYHLRMVAPETPSETPFPT